MNDPRSHQDQHEGVEPASPNHRKDLQEFANQLQAFSPVEPTLSWDELASKLEKRADESNHSMAASPVVAAVGRAPVANWQIAASWVGGMVVGASLMFAVTFALPSRQFDESQDAVARRSVDSSKRVAREPSVGPELISDQAIVGQVADGSMDENRLNKSVPNQHWPNHISVQTVPPFADGLERWIGESEMDSEPSLTAGHLVGAQRMVSARASRYSAPISMPKQRQVGESNSPSLNSINLLQRMLETEVF